MILGFVAEADRLWRVTSQSVRTRRNLGEIAAEMADERNRRRQPRRAQDTRWQQTSLRRSGEGCSLCSTAQSFEIYHHGRSWRSCSIRASTSHRSRRCIGFSKRRRMQKHRESSRKPQKRHRPDELLATAPNQVWSWDITYLASPVRGAFFYAYVVMNVFSRKIVGFARPRPRVWRSRLPAARGIVPT